MQLLFKWSVPSDHGSGTVRGLRCRSIPTNHGEHELHRLPRRDILSCFVPQFAYVL